jgi:predicted transglutaminase-like cysteine proteinase
MGIGKFVHTCRIALLAGVAVLASPASSPAFPWLAAPSVQQIELDEPFGRPASLLHDGGLPTKWRGVEREVAKERELLATCRADRVHCPSEAALQFLAIAERAHTRDGLARFGEINRAVNLAIRPVSDLENYGVIDYWSSPLATLAKGSGDCEDYAIAKLFLLREIGVAADDVRLVIVHDLKHDEDHAVVAARFEGRWRILDNRRLMMLPDTDIADYRAAFVIDDAGVRSYQDLAPAEAVMPAKVPPVDAIVSGVGLAAY